MLRSSGDSNDVTSFNVTSPSTTGTGAAGFQPVDFSARRQQMDKVMSAVADQLGMSASDLKDALKGGKSLADVASAKGISQDQLTATIKQALQSAGASGTDDQLTQLASRIATHHRGQHHRGVQAPPPAATSDASSASTSPTGVATSTNVTLLQVAIGSGAATTTSGGTTGANVDTNA